jgi:predicted O-methyltransferase YrrM
MSVTERITSFVPELQAVPEVSAGGDDFSMFNSGSTEIEVGEFLYALVRIVKLWAILETGTYIGVSSAYMGLALVDNGCGALITLEVSPEFVSVAKELWQQIGVDDRLTSILQPSLEFDPGSNVFDIVFLDSEPHLRFDEFVKFWPNVRAGGFILIHDLHSHLGHSDQVINGLYDWPYGDFRLRLGKFITSHQVQVLSFPTPRGMTIFQKMSEAHGVYNLLTGKW